MKKNIYKILIFLIISIVLEVMLFNITSFRVLLGGYNKEYIDLSNLEIGKYSDYIEININDINQKVGTLKIDFTDEVKNYLDKYDQDDDSITKDYVVEYKVFFSDETSSELRGLNSKNYIPGKERTSSISLYLSGNVNSLTVRIYGINDVENPISGVKLNYAIPFDFNIIRVILVTFIIACIYYFNTEKIFKEAYVRTSLKQEAILMMILVVFFGITTFINVNSKGDDNQVYSVDFVNAINEGKLSLDFEPSEEFKALDDPYDDLSRGSLIRGVDYLWDSAYYNGNFYVYFGILPLLILFLPYYLITKTYLAMSSACFIFSLINLILLKEILSKIVLRYFEKIPFKNMCYYMIILLSGSLIIYANGLPRVYEMSILSALTFVLAGILVFLMVLESDNKKYLKIFAGSLFMALSVACRPTALFASLIIAPLLLKEFIYLIKNVKENKINLVKFILAVAIPYLTVGILLMIYNYARFGSPFEFGSSYQITIVNMTSLGSRIFAIPLGIIANIFSFPNIIADFPFITQHNDLMGGFYGYYYIENMIGGVFILAPICFFNFAIYKALKKEKNKELKIFIIMLDVAAIIIALFSIMMAGSNQRYLIDYAWMFILAGIMIFSIIYKNLKTEEAKKIYTNILKIFMIVTLFFGITSGIIGEKDALKDNSPREYNSLKYTICFWE